jgi:Domain of unknown function (DUF1992)
MNGPQLLNDEIGRKLAEAEASGELRSAESYGKPMAADAAWDQTPLDLRMPFKILKNAGVQPPEIALFHERARLRTAVETAADETQRKALQQQLSELEQRLSLRLEALRMHGSL